MSGFIRLAINHSQAFELSPDLPLRAVAESSG
jgi:hypothetical protein